jgi:tetratricopeptide (TPR) repeat protein
LILDQLETFIRLGENDDWEAADPGLRLLLGRLSQLNAGMCVVGTRVPLGKWLDLKASRGVVTRNLEPLSRLDGVELFRIIGEDVGRNASQEAIENLVTRCNGNPQAIEFLAGRARREGRIGDTSDLDNLAADQLSLGDPAAQALESTMKWLESSDKGKQWLAILKLFGFFSGTVPKPALDVLRPRVMLDRLSDREYLDSLDKLAEMRLIRIDRDASGNVSTVHCAQHVCDYLRSLLLRSEQVWQLGCAVLFEYFRNATCVQGKEDDLAKIRRLFTAVAYGCHVKKYEDAFCTYWRDAQQGSMRVATYTHGMIAEDLHALSGFFQTEQVRPTDGGPPRIRTLWSKPVDKLSDEQKAFLLIEGGRGLWHRSWYLDAITAFKKAEELARELKCWFDAAEAARRIGENQVEMGKLKEARESTRRAIEYAEKSLNKKPRRLCLAERFDKEMKCELRANDPRPPTINFDEPADCQVLHGKVLHQMGDATAGRAFKKAEDLYRQRRKVPMLFDVWGFWQWDWMIDQNDEHFVDDVLERVKWSSERLKPRPVLLMQGLHELMLARVAMRKRRFKEAMDFITLAADNLKKSNQHPHYLYGLQVQAEICLEAGDRLRASATLDLIEVELRYRGYMVLRKIDCELLRARLHLRQGEQQEAKRHLERAESLIKEEAPDYRRREAWRKDLAKELA